MAKRINVVVSQGQSANPAKRGLEEDLVAALLMEPGIEVTVVGHLNDLTPDGTGMLALGSIAGDMIVASWLFPRAAHWILDRNGVRGRLGKTLLDLEAEEEDEEELDEAAEEPTNEDHADGSGDGPHRPALPNRTIYYLDLRQKPSVDPYVEEVRRLAAEMSVETVSLMGWIGGSPKPEQLDRYLHPTRGVENREGNGTTPTLPVDAVAQAAGDSSASESPIARRIDEQAERRWYPVIDYTRCTNCMECIDFCLFGVYGVDSVETILVEQPDNCRKGCPACSRVCPENAIIFPQHKTPAIAGSPSEDAGVFKIDLSKLFGAPDALGVAVEERDRELVAAGRDAVGATVGMPKRQANKQRGDKDDLDNLMDKLDELEL